MKWENQEESENTRIINEIIRQEDSEITRLIFSKYSEILDLRNPGNQCVNALKRVIGKEEKFKREKSMERERECVFRGDARIADAGTASRE